jgi:hypothetical protein
VAPVAQYKKAVPLTTQSITPVAAPAPTVAPTPAVVPVPISLPAPVSALQISLEEQLQSAWKHLCGLRNIEHVEKGRINESEAQKHFIDEKCAEARRYDHMQ